MKKIYLIVLFLCFGISALAQTDGLSYQALIIDPNPQEIPGVDITGNILANTELRVRFSIADEVRGLEYQEEHSTRTDAYGMINLVIGDGRSTNGEQFTTIVWDGNRKDLLVEIKIGGDDYKELTNDPLLFVPYALHRDIIATGNLTVDGSVLFGGDLVVQGTTNLNDALAVTNESPTNLSGALTVDGITNLYDKLQVLNESTTNLTGKLTVRGITSLKDSLTVDGRTSLLNTLTVEGETNLNNGLDVRNQSRTNLTGTLEVEGETFFENNVEIRNGSSLNVSGDLNVLGETTFDNDLTVNGMTNLNNSLRVNNNAPTNLTGILTVGEETLLNNSLKVEGVTNLENDLNVNGASPTSLTGDLTVDGETNLNSALNVNNGSPTNLSGTLTVDGGIEFGDDLTVNGMTNLNDDLSVNNGATSTLTGDVLIGGATDLSSTLLVEGATTMESSLDVINGGLTNLTGTLNVDGETTLNDNLTVANASPTSLTGTLQVDEATTLNNSLLVANASPTNLSGTLTVDEATVLNNGLSVTNLSATNLSGLLTVGELTTLQNGLEVANGSGTILTGTLSVELDTNLANALFVTNASPTALSGTLTVDGETNLNNTLTVDGPTLINNSLTVNGSTTLGSITTSSINVESASNNYVATFSNTDPTNGDGILIRLGRTHGAWNGSGYYSKSNPVSNLLSGAANVVGNKLRNPSSGPFLTPDEILQLVPVSTAIAAAAGITNLIFDEVNDRLNLPIYVPEITVPRTRILDGFTVFGGVTVPVVDIRIPAFRVPNVDIPRIPILPRFPILPALPNLPINGLSIGSLNPIDEPNVGDSLSKENEYITFADSAGRKTGSIRAQSMDDFRSNTINDEVFVLNVASSFIGADLLDALVSGSVEITNLYDAFNKIGVEYSSGNGDYAEWLPRANNNEYITSGDIVGVVGGKISKDLSNFEQIMVVSHHPIILGNAPEEGQAYKGNNVAFMGQVPVKVLGPVKTGDYIVASAEIKGYGVAKSANEMTAADFKKAVGRSWEENLTEGPKTINTVVGVHNGDWVTIIKKIDQKQKAYEAQFKSIEAKVESLQEKADEILVSKQD